MDEEITQDTATLNLLMHQEVDKRIMLALSRALDPTNAWREKEIISAYDISSPAKIQSVVRGMLIDTILSDGSLMHNIRSKLAEQLNRPY